MASSRSTAWALWRRRSRAASRRTSRILPMVSALQPGQGAEAPAGAVSRHGLLDERPVAHRDHPIGGGGDLYVVGDDDQRLPGPVQVVEQLQHVPGGSAV